MDNETIWANIMNKRDILRKEAKKIYKQQIKDVPKHQRMPFAQFFKNYMKSLKQKPAIESEGNEEDFDFDDLINMNNLNEEETE